MINIKLNNGKEMPVLGFGVFQIRDQKLCEESVIEAIRTGYRLIDTAAIYLNEEAVGKAIKKSGVSRSELFITTKLEIEHISYDKAKTGFRDSLKRLQLDYVDLYLIHHPIGDIHGAWRALEELYNDGGIKSIGVCNFTPARLMDLMITNRVKPAVNQIETHIFCQRIEEQKFMVENNIQLEAWGPLAEGKNNIFQNETLMAIAKKHKKTVAQIILRWLVQRMIVAIPKSVHPERIRENFNIFDFELDNKDMSDHYCPE